MMKPWYKSKTMWFNIITLILGVAAALLGVVETKAWVIGLTVLMALGNGILRLYFTDTKIG
jgi:hypothetical protein